MGLIINHVDMEGIGGLAISPYHKMAHKEGEGQKLFTWFMDIKP